MRRPVRPAAAVHPLPVTVISAWWQFALGLCMGGIAGCVFTLILIDVTVKLRDQPEDPDSGR